MQKLEDCDDRALVLDGNQLQALRWGGVQNQFQAEAESFVADVNKAIESA
jgi:hypothetical protein